MSRAVLVGSLLLAACDTGPVRLSKILPEPDAGFFAAASFEDAADPDAATYGGIADAGADRSDAGCTAPPDYCYPHASETAGLGICHPGVWRCLPGMERPICTAQGPTREECDGVDNDCDGATDEDFDANACRDVLWILDISCSNTPQLPDIRLAISDWEQSAAGPLDQTFLFEGGEPEHVYSWLIERIPLMPWRDFCAHYAVVFVDESMGDQVKQTGTATGALSTAIEYQVDLIAYSFEAADWATIADHGPLGAIDLTERIGGACY